MATSKQSTKDQIRAMRAEGLTYKRIAEHFNRSIMWVYDRNRDINKPRRTQPELIFQQYRVVPFLLRQGFKIIDKNSKIGHEFWAQTADLIALKDDQPWIIEVKKDLDIHALQRGIGQVIIHRFGSPDATAAIAFPDEVVDKRLTPLFCEYLKALGIELLRVK